MRTCPEVDKRWIKDGTDNSSWIDIDWLKEHVETCETCQQIMAGLVAMFDDIEDE